MRLKNGQLLKITEGDMTEYLKPMRQIMENIHGLCESLIKSAPKGVDEEKYKRCKKKVKAKSPGVNEYAVCTASLTGKSILEICDLIKGAGEGSRGGKIIGHTRSGKPIYGGPGSVRKPKGFHDEWNESGGGIWEHKTKPLAISINDDKTVRVHDHSDVYDGRGGDTTTDGEITKHKNLKDALKHVSGITMTRKSVISISNICDDLIKGAGEGSKGGTVIGHTQSGKPIYASAGSKDHKEFHAQDHLDAVHTHHSKVAQLTHEHMRLGNGDGTISKKDMKRGAAIKKQIEKHRDAASRHADKHEKLSGKASSSGPSQRDFDRMDRRGDKDKRSRGWGRSMDISNICDDLIKGAI